eukprot:GHRR01017651.1.p1 GENE.GHRR01017651.1~~GHRR01017651.1.p1  ORF type:complete len:193 (+),score=58.59 GHRR01017651.1:572-1150(+)
MLYDWAGFSCCVSCVDTHVCLLLGWYSCCPAPVYRWLYSNQLTSLPPQLGKLRQLRKLWVDRNKLTAVPEQLGDCSALQELYLDHNQLKTLPASLAKLSHLRKLYLENNPGLVIPDAFKALPSLKVGDYAAMPPTAAHQGPPATPAAPAAAGLVSQGMNGLSLHNGSQQPAPSSHVAFLFDPVRLVEQQDKY